MSESKRAEHTKAKVAVTRCTDYQADAISQAVDRQFSLLGGLAKFVSRGDTVLLKPNFIAPKPREQAAQTNPAVLLAVARMVKDFGGKPFIADSPAWQNTFACVKALEMEQPLKELGIPVVQLNKPKRHKIAGGSVGISTIALQADRIINLPKFKSHQQLGATFAIKNMFGCVCGKEKAFWHFARGKTRHGFCQMLIEIYKLLAPVVTIIDGVVAMEGPGPIRGRARPLGFLVGGIDPVACELVCCELINFSPLDMPMIRTARHLGFGCSHLSQVTLVGDDYSGFICTDFQYPEQVPIRFSLPHVCKSIAKQIILTVKSL